MKIVIYSWHQNEVNLYAHVAESQLAASVVKCYDSFSLRRSLPGAHCAVIIRNSANTQTNFKTSTLISQIRREYKVRHMPIILIDQKQSIGYETGADKVLRGLHPMSDFIDAILELSREVAA